MPFCTVADRCLRCDNVRAGREIKRLREVLRTTLDAKLAVDEEVKDLNAKVAKLEKGLYELQCAVRLVQIGKISACDIFVPGPAMSANTPVPNSVMQGVFR